MSGLRRFLRSAAYRSGVLSIARSRNRHALTVIMLHRVLDPADPDFAHADPTFTLSVPIFEQLLGFIQRHYAVIGLRDVMRACDGTGTLPDHALLITFDDGWADNLRHAAPLLRDRGLPAVVFAVPDAILSPGDSWWQEDMFAAVRAGVLHPATDDGDTLPSLNLLARVAQLDAPKRAEFLATLPGRPCHARMMLTPDELPQLAAYGIDVGLHGYTHVPLTLLPDVATELTRASQAVAALSAGTATTTALGCPHGLYNDTVIAGAHAAGVKLIFTSDPHLNRTQAGGLTPARPIGRINVVGRQIEAAPHRLDPSAAARWLWARDCR